MHCDEYVCLSVCPLAYLEYYTAELHQIFRACWLWLWLSGLIFCRRCDTLCTSGFVDDVLYSHNGRAQISLNFRVDSDQILLGDNADRGLNVILSCSLGQSFIYTIALLYAEWVG